MKRLIALLLIATQAWAGLPPTTTQGQGDASSKTKFAFQVPNNQATDLGGVKVLFETGNENLLLNPNFQQASSVFASWTLGSGVAGAVDTSVKVGNDPQSLKLTLTAASGDIITQDVTPSGSVKGVNLEDSFYVNTTLTTLQVCTRAAGTTSTSNCTSVPATGQWVLVVDNQPGAASGSQGLSLYATGSSTGTVNVSRGYHGLARNVAGVAQSKVLGTITWSCTGTWTLTGTTSYTSFPAATGCNAPTLTGTAQRPATDIPAIKFPYVGSGDLILQYEGEVQNTVNGQQSGFQFWDGTNTAREESWCGNSTIICPGITQSISYTTPQNNVTFQVRAKTGTSGGANLRPDVGVQVIKVIWFPSSTNGQVLQTTDQSDFGWTSYTPTLSASFGTISGLSAQYKRIGDTLFVHANFVSGTLTAALGSISLPGTLAIDTSKMDFAGTAVTGNAGQIVGHYASDNTATGSGGSILAGTNTSTTNVYIGGLFSGTSSSGSIRFINMSSLTATSQFNIDFSVPISTWANTNRAPNLIGSVATSATAGSDHIERAVMSAICTSGTCGSVSSTPGISNITWSTTGQYNVNFAAGTFSAPPACIVTGNAAVTSNGLCYNQSVATTSLQLVGCKNLNTYVFENDDFSIICMGPR